MNKSGSALVITVGITTIIVAIILTLSSIVYGYRKSSNVLQDQTKYHAVSLAAMAYTLNCINNEPELLDIEDNAEFSVNYMEKYPVVVVRKDENNYVATFKYRGDYDSNIVESCVIKKEQLFAEKEYNMPGMFADEAFELGGSMKVGIYDSDPITEEDNVTVVGSNDNVTVKKPTNIQGYPDSVQSSMGMEMPEYNYKVPEEFIELGALTGTVTLNSGIYHCSTATLTNLTINGTVVIFVEGAFDVKTKLTIPKTSFLTVHQNDFSEFYPKTNLNGNMFANSKDYPQNFLWLTAYKGEITFNGNAVLGGMIMAPYAEFKLNGTFDMHGSIFTKTFGPLVNGNFKFTYDTELSKFKIKVPIPSKVVYSIIRYMNNF
jgi:hypothetical protein